MMKYVAKVLGPLTRREWAEELAVAAIFVICIGAGLTLSIKSVVHGSEGWRTTTGVVVHPGTKPESSSDKAETKSLVAVPMGERTVNKVLILPWYKLEGAKISPLWYKNGETRQSSPSAIGTVIWRPVLWALMGAALGLVAFLVLGGLLDAVDEHEKNLKREADERLDASRAQPESFAELEELLAANPDASVTVAQATRYGACKGGVEGFRDEEFPGRRSVTLAELLAKVGDGSRPGDHLYLLDIITGRLKDLGLIKSTYNCRSFELKKPAPEPAAEV